MDAFENQLRQIRQAEVDILTAEPSEATETQSPVNPPVLRPISHGVEYEASTPLITVQGSTAPDWDLLTREAASPDLLARLPPYSPAPMPAQEAPPKKKRKRTRRRKGKGKGQAQQGGEAGASEALDQFAPAPSAPQLQNPQEARRPATQPVSQEPYEDFPSLGQLHDALPESPRFSPSSSINADINADINTDLSSLPRVEGTPAPARHRRRRSSIPGPSVAWAIQAPIGEEMAVRRAADERRDAVTGRGY